MASFEIQWKASAKKELKKIDKVEIPKIGNYRVIYSIENEQLVIEIIRIRHRKEAYRKFP